MHPLHLLYASLALIGLSSVPPASASSAPPKQAGRPSPKRVDSPLTASQKRLQGDLFAEFDRMKTPEEVPARLPRLEAILKRGAPVNTSLDGMYPLMVAALDERLTALLLKYGARPNVRDKDGMTPLHMAAMLGEPGTVRRLLKAGAAPESRDKDGDSPLFSAVMNDKAANLKALIEGGAHVDTRRRDGSTPLIMAAALHKADSVETLLERGANPNARDKDGMTALQATTMLPFLAKVAALDDKRDLTPEEQADLANYRRIVGLLKSAGATEGTTGGKP